MCGQIDRACKQRLTWKAKQKITVTHKNNSKIVENQPIMLMIRGLGIFELYLSDLTNTVKVTAIAQEKEII